MKTTTNTVDLLALLSDVEADISSKETNEAAYIAAAIELAGRGWKTTDGIVYYGTDTAGTVEVPVYRRTGRGPVSRTVIVNTSTLNAVWE